jgi:hypothetical protein
MTHNDCCTPVSGFWDVCSCLLLQTKELANVAGTLWSQATRLVVIRQSSRCKTIHARSKMVQDGPRNANKIHHKIHQDPIKIQQWILEVEDILCESIWNPLQCANYDFQYVPITRAKAWNLFGALFFTKTKLITARSGPTMHPWHAARLGTTRHSQMHPEIFNVHNVHHVLWYTAKHYTWIQWIKHIRLCIELFVVFS